MATGEGGLASRSVAVLMGGPSAEHDVSLVSGRAIAHALAERGHAVSGWLIDLDGGWWRLPPDAMDRSIEPVRYDAPAALGAEGPLAAAAALELLAAETPPAVVFVALHGPFGEDGTVQALLESAGLVYTGARVAASAVGMDKTLFKRVAVGIGIPVVPWLELTERQLRVDREGSVRSVRDFAATLRDHRVIVKPARLGSSVGISIVHDVDHPQELEASLDAAFRYDDLVLVEAYLAGARELEVSVVGNDASDVAAYGPGEIFPGHEFYDFTAKYQEGVSQTTDRPDLDRGTREQILDFAQRAYLAIGTTGFARVDFLVAGGRVHLNEINTVPGFTPISLFPVLSREGGYDFGGISERIVQLAVELAERRPAHRLSRADLP